MTKVKKDGLKCLPIFKFEWVTFEEEKIKKDQDKLNESIGQGYEIVQHFQTPTGVVFALIKKMSNHEQNSNQKVMEDYGFDSKIGGSSK